MHISYIRDSISIHLGANRIVATSAGKLQHCIDYPFRRKQSTQTEPPAIVLTQLYFNRPHTADKFVKVVPIAIYQAGGIATGRLTQKLTPYSSAASANRAQMATFSCHSRYQHSRLDNLLKHSASSEREEMRG